MEMEIISSSSLFVPVLTPKQKAERSNREQDSNTDIEILEDRVKKKRHCSAHNSRAIWLGTISKWSY